MAAYKRQFYPGTTSPAVARRRLMDPKVKLQKLREVPIEDVVKLADNTENGFCTACFGGGYPTSIPKDGGKDRFECKISEGEKKKNA